jgi:hypothetical protein
VSHPSELTLEAHLLTPSAEVTAHAAGCALCTGRLARMAEEGETFHREVYPGAVAAVRAAATAAERPARSWRLVALPVAAAAAAAALVLLVRPPGPGPDYVGLKGGALGLSAYVGTATDASAVADGAQVPADAALRFSLRTAGPCQLWLASVDAGGQVSQLYPAAGSAPAALAQSGPLPGGAILDGQGGPERLYAVCTPRPLAWEALADRIRTAARGGVEGVRRAGPLRDLPDDGAQATLLLEKTR